MKLPQIVSLLVLFAGLGIFALKSDEPEVAPPSAPEAAAKAVEPAPEAAPETPAKRPVFSGPHDGSHVYQGVLCPACEKGPMEF